MCSGGLLAAFQNINVKGSFDSKSGCCHVLLKAGEVYPVVCAERYVVLSEYLIRVGTYRINNTLFVLVDYLNVISEVEQTCHKEYSEDTAEYKQYFKCCVL